MCGAVRTEELRIFCGCGAACGQVEEFFAGSEQKFCDRDISTLEWPWSTLRRNTVPKTALGAIVDWCCFLSITDLTKS